MKNMPETSVNDKEKEILSKLIIDEKRSVADLEELVRLAEGTLGIEKTGQIVILNRQLNGLREQCMLGLIGANIANKLSLRSDPDMAPQELSSLIGKPVTTLSKPLGQLINDGFASRIDGKYRCAFYRAKEYLQMLRKD